MITQTKRNDLAILALSGRLDFNARHDYQSAIQKAKESGAHRIVLNLKDVSFIDSAALGLITVAFKDLQQAKIGLVLAEAQDYVKKIFDLANLGNIIPIFSTVDEAVSARVTVAK